MGANKPWWALGETQGFKWTPQDTHAHSGIDLNTFEDSPRTGVGVPITAPFDGVEVSEGREPWGGQVNELVKDTNGGYEVLSWLHLEDEEPIAPGSPIKAGQLLGHSGTPPPKFGNGPHIHFERTLGKIPPYMASYNPWYPTKSSYPLNPQPVLDQLKGGGNAQAVIAGFESQIPGNGAIGPDPYGIGAAFAGFESSVNNDIGDVKVAVIDGIKRAGVFLIGIVVLIVGLVILFQPQIEEAVKEAGKLAGDAGKAAAVAA